MPWSFRSLCSQDTDPEDLHVRFFGMGSWGCSLCGGGVREEGPARGHMQL